VAPLTNRSSCRKVMFPGCRDSGRWTKSSCPEILGVLQNPVGSSKLSSLSTRTGLFKGIENDVKGSGRGLIQDAIANLCLQNKKMALNALCEEAAGSRNSINRLGSVAETSCVCCEVRTVSACSVRFSQSTATVSPNSISELGSVMLTPRFL
jgi:hypothetical protein